MAHILKAQILQKLKIIDNVGREENISHIKCNLNLLKINLITNLKPMILTFLFLEYDFRLSIILGFFFK